MQREQRRKLGKKAQKLLVKAAEPQNNDLITATLSTVTSVWVSDACYERYTHPKMLTQPWLLRMSVLEINQINHSRDVVNLLHLVTENIG